MNIPDNLDAFNAYDSRMADLESDMIRNSPHCCICGEPILDEMALCDNGEWCCNNPDCEAEFLQSIKEYFLKFTD